jgi:hypothetical protein
MEEIYTSGLSAEIAPPLNESSYVEGYLVYVYHLKKYTIQLELIGQKEVLYLSESVLSREIVLGNLSVALCALANGLKVRLFLDSNRSIVGVAAFARGT